MMRWVNLAVAAVFVWCATVQFNDPDPVVWIAVYTAAAVMAGLAAVGLYYAPALLLLGVIVLVWMGTLVGGVSEFLAQGDAGLLFTGMSPERPYVELTREFLGLGIVLVSCAIYFWLGRRAKSA